MEKTTLTLTLTFLLDKRAHEKVAEAFRVL